MNHLTILNYHGIESKKGEYPWLKPETPYVLDKKTFERQLSLLAENSFSSLDLHHLGEWLNAKSIFPKAIMITFDDGHESHLRYAGPALIKHHFHGLFFVSAGLLGKNKIMNATELKELSEMGFEIGSHGLRHVPLTGLSDAALKEELSGSKQILEDILQKPIRSFSIPRGFYHARIEKQARESGYDFMFTSQYDTNPKSQCPWHLKRIVIKNDIHEKLYLSLIHGRLGLKRPVEALKSFVRSSIPAKLYDTLAAYKLRLKDSY